MEGWIWLAKILQYIKMFKVTLLIIEKHLEKCSIGEIEHENCDFKPT